MALDNQTEGSGQIGSVMSVEKVLEIERANMKDVNRRIALYSQRQQGIVDKDPRGLQMASAVTIVVGCGALLALAISTGNIPPVLATTVGILSIGSGAYLNYVAKQIGKKK